MRVSITVYTTRRAEYRLRKISRWMQDTALPVIGWAAHTIAAMAGCAAVFFLCGMDNRELAPVMQGFLVSVGIAAGSGALAWILRR